MARSQRRGLGMTLNPHFLAVLLAAFLCGCQSVGPQWAGMLATSAMDGPLHQPAVAPAKVRQEPIGATTEAVAPSASASAPFASNPGAAATVASPSDSTVPSQPPAHTGVWARMVQGFAFAPNDDRKVSQAAQRHAQTRLLERTAARAQLHLPYFVDMAIARGLPTAAGAAALY